MINFFGFLLHCEILKFWSTQTFGWLSTCHKCLKIILYMYNNFMSNISLRLKIISKELNKSFIKNFLDFKLSISTREKISLLLSSVRNDWFFFTYVYYRCTKFQVYISTHCVIKNYNLRNQTNLKPVNFSLFKKKCSTGSSKHVLVKFKSLHENHNHNNT